MDSFVSLCGLSASIGLLHTLLGPDHYVPFVAIARAAQWSFARTMCVTLVCGIGHVLGSVVLGIIGIAFGVGVARLENIEASRADLAGWLLLASGIVYLAWGIRRAIRNKPHTHRHVHADGTVHTHEHVHEGNHLHVHGFPSGVESERALKPSVTPWVLFTVFLFGPCEPLIPILMYPAAKGSMIGVVTVTLVFAVTTLMTMSILVGIGFLTARTVTLRRMERYSHAVAGGWLAACGLAIKLGF